MTNESERETIAETLESVFAHTIGNIQGFIDVAPGLCPAPVERLAELVQLARDLEFKTERLADEVDRDQAGDGSAQAEREDIHKIREMAEPGSPAADLADGIEAELDDEPDEWRPYWRDREREREAADMLDPEPYDDLMLKLDRVDAILMAINDVAMSGEKRDLVGLTGIARSYIAAIERVCERNSKRWS